MHGNVLIVDDPHKPPDLTKEDPGASSLEMASDVAWFWSSLFNRRTNPGICPIIIIMQRLHTLDLTQSVVEKAKRMGLTVNEIVLPCDTSYEIKPERAKELYKEGLLEPVRFGRKILKQFKGAMGSRIFGAQYGQTPTPGEGNLVNPWAFDFYNKEEIEGWECNAICDTAFGNAKTNRQKATADPYGILSFALNPARNKIYAINYSEMTVKVPQFTEALENGLGSIRSQEPRQVQAIIGGFGRPEKERYSDDKPLLHAMGLTTDSYLIIEAAASGVGIIQALKNTSHYNVRGSKVPQNSKFDRFKTQTRKIEGGRLLLPRGEVELVIPMPGGDKRVEKVEPWVPNFINQLCGFPNLPHDEAADCTEIALRLFLRGV